MINRSKIRSADQTLDKKIKRKINRSADDKLEKYIDW